MLNNRNQSNDWFSFHLTALNTEPFGKDYFKYRKEVKWKKKEKKKEKTNSHHERCLGVGVTNIETSLVSHYYLVVSSIFIHHSMQN